MVEVKLDIPDWEAYSTEHYLSVRVGDVQKLTRISAHRTFRIPASAVGNRRYAKVEVFRRVGNGSICIDTEVAKTANDASVAFEGNELQYSVTVSPLKGEVKAAPLPLDKKTLEEKSNPKLMDAKDYLERHHMEARLSEAMQALIRSRPPDPALFLATQLATNAGVLDKLPRKQDPVKEELERLHGLFPGCSLDGGASSSSTDLYPRAWVKAPAVPRAAASGLPLHVAQFNVLADGLSGMCETQGGFTDVPMESLAWRYRRGRLVEELFRHGIMPDVITMQEVDHFFDWFQPVLEGLGYEGRFLAKPDSPCRKSLDNILEDGCALFWRKEVLSMRHLETMRFGVAAGQPSNQVALVAEMRPLDGTHPFVLATTHLSAKKTSEGEQARALQASELLALLRSKGLPCVLGMDMNAAPARNSCANYDCEAYPAVMRHSVGLRSAYAVALGAEPSYTTWKRRGASEAKHTIDYILTSGSIAVERVLAPPAEYDMAPERLPGWRYPSDHVALLAELRLPKEPLSAPFAAYVQQHMPAYKPEATLGIYSKFPLNHSAKAAAAAKHARVSPPILPFGDYCRNNVTSLAPELLSRMHNRFPAARRAAELRISGPEVLTGAMPHFGVYYSKHFPSASSSGLDKFHERERQRAKEEAAKKIPAPLLNLSFFLYYKRHCVPDSGSALRGLYGKFRKKPKPVARRKPEPLVSLSYFLYYNRYVLPSSTVSYGGLYEKFGRGHLEPKAAAPTSPLHSSSRTAQALLAPASPVGGHSRTVFQPTSAAGAQSSTTLQVPPSQPRVAPGDSASAPPTVPPVSEALEDSLRRAPPRAPPEGYTEPEAAKEVPPVAPEEEDGPPRAPVEVEDTVFAPAEEGEEPSFAPEEAGDEPTYAPAEAESKVVLPSASVDEASWPPEKFPYEGGEPTVAEAVKEVPPLAPEEEEDDGPPRAPVEVANTVLAPAEEGEESGEEPGLAPEEAGEEPTYAPAEAESKLALPPKGVDEAPWPPEKFPYEEGEPTVAEAVKEVPPVAPEERKGHGPPLAPAEQEAPALAPAEEEEPPVAPGEALDKRILADEEPLSAPAEAGSKALPSAVAEEDAPPPPPMPSDSRPRELVAEGAEAGAKALQKSAPPPAAAAQPKALRRGKTFLIESFPHEICRALRQELYRCLATKGSGTAAAEPAKEELPQPPKTTFQYRLEEPKDPVFGPYFSEHMLQPYGPGEGFAALYERFAASRASAE